MKITPYINETFCNDDGDIVSFSDRGITFEYTLGNNKMQRYYPYGSIKSIRCNDMHEIMLEVKVEDYSISLNFNESDRIRLSQSVQIAKSMILEAQKEEIVEPQLHYTSSQSEDTSAQAESSQLSAEQEQFRKWSETRVTWRNRGLRILLVSVGIMLLTCFVIPFPVLTLASVFGIFIGLMMFGSHLKPTGYVRTTKNNAGTKEIIKGAVIGGIVAGEAGAVVGATIAKNNLDNKK